MHKQEFQVLKFKAGPKLPFFQLNTQQIFVARWMSLSGRRRMFLKHMTGSGKTITGLQAAYENWHMYNLAGEGRLIIVSWQKDTFLREMISNPELGYVSHREWEVLNSLEGEEHVQYLSHLKKRIEHVKFFGYQELYNSLFPESEKKIDADILKLFSNAFVICDEIHNVYNSQDINSYGNALKTIIQHFAGAPDEPKILFMSATPINNKPREILDIISLLVPDSKLKFGDLFTDKGEVIRLRPSALGIIQEVLYGYFSFYINEDISLMPSWEFVSEDNVRVGKIQEDYIKFIRCPQTADQKKQFARISKVKFDDHNIYDACFGDIYKTLDLQFIKELQVQDNVPLGTGLIATSLRKYSEKYFVMLRHLLKEPGKILIYHPYVSGTGLKFIENILITNGFLPENGIITNTTLCICGVTKEVHETKPSGCEFTPARFLMVNGDMDKKLQESKIDLFNHSANRRGNHFKILLGSEVIKEGKNFKCVRAIYIMHILKHISALLQVIGRGVRMHSHDLLPPEDRNVKIKIFAVDPEIEKYKRKLENYKVVQQIERALHESSVDIGLYYNIVKKSFRDHGLGILPFKPKKMPIAVDHRTYNVFYGGWEIEEIRKIIMALFLQCPMWNYTDLLAAVRDPPFRQNMDFSQVSEDNFVMALGELMYGISPPIIKNRIGYRITAVSSSAEKRGGETIYYVLYPLKDNIEVHGIGVKIENAAGYANVNAISWLQPDVTYEVRLSIHEDITMLNVNYEDMKEKFYRKFVNADFLELSKSTETYGNDFHHRLLEDCIDYVFRVLTHTVTKSEYHELYFKMLHFYSKLDLIIYANALPLEYANMYQAYITGEVNTNNLLVANITNATTSISSFELSEINKFVSGKKQKIASNILPVGHLLQTEVKLYTTHGWITAKNFLVETAPMVENDYIIGYYEASKNSINYKFKLRKPVHKLVSKKDRREMERGINCESKKKEELVEIAKTLGTAHVGTNYEICEYIKVWLLQAELKDRNRYRKGKVTKRTRYCYMQYEDHTALLT